MSAAMLALEDVHSYYGDSHVIQGVSLAVERGETVALVGRNGAGKTTLLKTAMAIVPARRGRVLFAGDDVTRLDTHAIARRGMTLVPEDRRIFPRLTVEENLLLGAYRPIARDAIARNLAFCHEVFPRLAERRTQLAGSMSGGEQQMLTLARALMTAPKILLIDEPSVGLSPLLVSHIINQIRDLKERYGLTVLMAEQNFHQAIRIADRGYVIVHGRIEYEGSSRDELSDNALIRKLYMGL